MQQPLVQAFQDKKERVERWDRRFLELCNLVSRWTKDRSQGVGAVLVGPGREILATGYNGIPRGLADDIEARHERPEKYLWAEHAERNAVYNAARVGVSTMGATAYLTGLPCMDCGRALIQAGIARIVAWSDDADGGFKQGKPGQRDWAAERRMAVDMLIEAGVGLVEYKA